MRLLPQTENIPPRVLRTLGAIQFSLQNAEIVNRVAAAFGKRHNVIQFVQFRVEALSRFTLPLRNYLAAHGFTYPAGSPWTATVNEQCREKANDRRRFPHPLVRMKDQKLNISNGRSENQRFEIAPNVLSTSPDAEEVAERQQPDARTNEKREKLRSCVVHKFRGKTELALRSVRNLATYVNGSILAFA
jgi:hypothetical protein